MNDVTNIQISVQIFEYMNIQMQESIFEYKNQYLNIWLCPNNNSYYHFVRGLKNTSDPWIILLNILFYKFGHTNGRNLTNNQIFK